MYLQFAETNVGVLVKMNDLTKKLFDKIPDKMLHKTFLWIIGADTFNNKMVDLPVKRQVIINKMRPTTKIFNEFILRSIVYSVVLYFVNYSFISNIFEKNMNEKTMIFLPLILVFICIVELLMVLMLLNNSFRRRTNRVGCYNESKMHKNFNTAFNVWTFLSFVPIGIRGWFGYENVWMIYIILIFCALIIGVVLDNINSKNNMIVFYVRTNPNNMEDFDAYNDVKIVYHNNDIKKVDLTKTEIYIDSDDNIRLIIDEMIDEPDVIKKEDIAEFLFKDNSFRYVNNNWITGSCWY